MKQSLSSDCQTMGRIFRRQNRLALCWSLGVILITALGLVGLLALGRYRLTDLEQQIMALKAAKQELDETVGSWPLKLKHLPDGKFLVPVPPHTLESGWTLDGQNAWKTNSRRSRS